MKFEVSVYIDISDESLTLGHVANRLSTALHELRSGHREIVSVAVREAPMLHRVRVDLVLNAPSPDGVTELTESLISSALSRAFAGNSDEPTLLSKFEQGSTGFAFA